MTLFKRLVLQLAAASGAAKDVRRLCLDKETVSDLALLQPLSSNPILLEHNCDYNSGIVIHGTRVEV